MSLSQGLSLYNQERLNDDDFVAQFVARGETLAALVRRLEAVRHDGTGGQQILIGPRGMGKTSLLRRLAIEINRLPALRASYVPLRFREEQYNVLKLGDFWRNCGEALAEWAEVHGRQDLADRLDASVGGAAWAGDEASAAQFAAEMTRLNRRAVLLVDNLDLILDALPGGDKWTLRRHLQAKGGPLVVGAATHELRDSAVRDAAFYEFFQPHHLDPLDAAETESCMRDLANRRGAYGEPVRAVLARQPARLKTLHVLTGGNPRVLALIYRLLESAETDQAMADLEVLLDQVTPYYKARIEEYQTPQQRAVIDAIALHWDPVTTGDLAQITGIASTTLSPLLIKLRKDGLIEQVDTSGSYAGHQLVERFLNIWYLMRHGTRRTKQKMRWLVAFLANFYSRSDLAGIADRMRTKGAVAWHPDYAFAVEEALFYAPAKDGADTSSYRIHAAENSWSAGLAVDTPDSLGQPGRAADAVKSALDQLNKGLTLGAAGDHAAAIAAFDEVIARFDDAPDAAIKEVVALSLVLKGISFWDAGDRAAAIVPFDEVVARFGDAPDAAIRAVVAMGLFNKGATFGEIGDRAAAIAAYDEVVARFGDAPDAGLRGQVAKALVNKGITLEDIGDRATAIAAYEEAIARFGDAPDVALREQVAKALFNKSLQFEAAGDRAAAIATYDDLIVRFGNASDAALREEAARALINKGAVFGELGDHVSAIAAFDEVISRFGDTPDGALREQIAVTLLNRGLAFRKIGDHGAAIAAYDDLIARFGDAPDAVLREQVASALVSKGSVFEQDDAAAAIAAYDEVIARFGDAPDVALKEQVAKALFNKSLQFEAAGDRAAAIATYDDLIARFGNASDAALRKETARALINKGVVFGELGDHVSAIAAFDEVASRFGDTPDGALREQIAVTLLNKGVTFRKIGDHVAAIAAYDDLIARFGDAPDAALRELVADALFWKGVLVERSGDAAAAIAAYEETITRFGEDEATGLQELVADAAVRCGNLLLDSQGDVLRAETLLRQAADTDPFDAGINLAWLYVLSDRVREAMELRPQLSEMPEPGPSLLDAGLALAQHNFGVATGHLVAGLQHELVGDRWSFDGDLERLLCLGEHQGYGEPLIAWFEQTGLADRLAPIHLALKAFVRSEAALLDANPETRGPARLIFDRLVVRRRALFDRPDAPAPPKPSRDKRGRGRPRKRS